MPILLFRILILTAVTLFYFTSLVRGQKIKDEIDETIYNLIHDLLMERYPKEESRVDCMVEALKENKNVDKIYSPQLLFNNGALKQKLEPYLPEVDEKCKKTDKVKNIAATTYTKSVGIGMIVGIASAVLTAV